jgi:NACalpha-BTF3-like transcription factor
LKFSVPSMSADPQNDDDQPQEPQQPQTGEQAQQARAMKNMGGDSSRELDAAKVQAAMARLNTVDEATKLAQQAESERAAQLAKVVVKQEDVELVQREFELDPKEADLVLRENGGNVVQAIQALLFK